MKITKRVGNTDIARRIAKGCGKFWPSEPWDELLEGMGYRITFEKIKPSHTTSQQGYYWASITFWGKELGYSAKEASRWLHEAVLCETFGVKEVRELRGREIEIPNQRSSRLSRDDYSLLIETMLRLAAESGIAIPNSEDFAA